MNRSAHTHDFNVIKIRNVYKEMKGDATKQQEIFDDFCV